MITMTNLAAIHGPRLWVGSNVAATVGSAYAPKQVPSRRMFGTVLPIPNPTDNSTGVSAQEHRHR